MGYDEFVARLTEAREKPLTFAGELQVCYAEISGQIQRVTHEACAAQITALETALETQRLQLPRETERQFVAALQIELADLISHLETLSPEEQLSIPGIRRVCEVLQKKVQL